MNERNSLTAEAVDNAKEEAYKKLQRLRMLYERGCIPDDEALKEVNNAIWEYFWGLLQKKGLRHRISPANWDVFLADYRLWSEGSPLDGNEKEAWLFDDHLDLLYHDRKWLEIVRISKPYGIGTDDLETEASRLDKIQFFRLMEAFHIPPEYFTPHPADIIVPEVHETHLYIDCRKWVICFDCIDDGGLLSDKAPLGKTFTLTNKLGLKAVVTITEDRTGTDRYGMDCDDYAPMGEYLAEGYIEGYTDVERKFPKVVIRTDGHGKITRLGIIVSDDDAAAFNKYPLWQEYFAWSSEAYKMHRDLMDELFDLFKIKME